MNIIPNSWDTKDLLTALKKRLNDMGCQVSDDFLCRIALDRKLVYKESVSDYAFAIYNTDLGDYALENIDKVNIHITFELY